VVLRIKNREAYQLATALAGLTGETLTEAVIRSLRERLQRESGRVGGEDLADELMRIGKRCAALPVLDPRGPDEILGYDQHGIPK
jgi:antitoxin VapB